MAITSGSVWEVRPTNGDNTFGGGFNASLAGAGTDYTQQNTAQLSLTDLVTAGVVTTLTSVTGGFTAAMVGNPIHIESGTNFTPGFYFIVTFTNTNTVVLDRAPTTGAGVTGAGKVGGATKSFNGQTTTTLAASIVAGNTVYVKNEAWNEAVSLTVNGTVALPIIVEGYNTSRGDAPTDSTRPVNDRANAAGVAFNIAGTNHMIRYLRVRRSGGSGFVTTVGLTQFIFCRSDTTGGSGFNQTIGGNNAYMNCESDLNTTFGFQMVDGVLANFFSCYSHDNTSTGIGTNLSGTAVRAFFCISESNASHGIGSGDSLQVLINCTINNNTGATTDGYNGRTPTNGSFFLNNIFSNNGRYGVNLTSGNSVYADFNDYFGNVTAARNNLTAGAHAQTLDPQFVDAPNGNFAIGTNLKALGYPGTFPGALSIGYMDIGAVQRLSSGASGIPFIIGG